MGARVHGCVLPCTCAAVWPIRFGPTPLAAAVHSAAVGARTRVACNGGGTGVWPSWRTSRSRRASTRCCRRCCSCSCSDSSCSSRWVQAVGRTFGHLRTLRDAIRAAGDHAVWGARSIEPSWHRRLWLINDNVLLNHCMSILLFILLYLQGLWHDDLSELENAIRSMSQARQRCTLVDSRTRCAHDTRHGHGCVPEPLCTA